MPRSVAHVSFSGAGGAGGVGTLLAREQSRRGILAKLFSVTDSDLRSQPLTAPSSTAAAVLDQYIIKRAGFGAPISLLRDHTQGVNWKALLDFDVIHLHGINGALSPTRLADHLATKQVVWTLHDMNPFTGACHFTLGCDGFTRSCSQCPAARTVFRPLVKKSFDEKSAAIGRLKNLTLVSPSQWLAEEAKRSSIFGSQTLEVINNPVGDEFFRSTAARTVGNDRDGLRIGVIAQNLSDPRKNVAEVHRAFLTMVERKIPAHLFLVGGQGHEFIGPNVHRLGNLPVPQLIDQLDSWDVLVNPSRAENAPLTIIEASARGCPTIAAHAGGMPAMVSELGQGSTYFSEPELVDALHRIRNITPRMRREKKASLRARAHELFAASSVVDSYSTLYEKYT